MLFMFGNGFDIAMGLKTSYRDFLMWYLSRKQDNSDIRVMRLKNAIQSDIAADINSWADLEMKLGEYTATYNDDEVEDFVAAYRDIKEKLNDYIKLQEKKIDYDVNGAFVYDELQAFVLHFYEYFPKNLKAILSNHINGVRDNVVYNFVNFNYTGTLEKCLNVKDNKVIGTRRPLNLTYTHSIGEVVHVHGEIDNSPLMGVDNSSQISNESFRDQNSIKWLMLKPHLNRELEHGVVENVTSLISNAYIICLFGLSLGNSDASWWRKIGAWLKANDGRKIIIFWYSHEKLSPVHADSKLIIEESVRKRFAKQANLSNEEYESIEQRIFVHVHNEFFKSKLISNKKRKSAIESRE